MNSVVDSDLKRRISGLISSGQLTKADFNLANVDNTTDLAKPVSTATQTALNLKVNNSAVGVASGVCALDSSGKVPSANMPTQTLSGLGDVQLASVSSGQIIAYNSTTSKWTNTAPSGGANLAQTPIIIGVGEGTASPQTVTLRGTAGAGASDIVPGDLVIQPPVGTGLAGTGQVRFQQKPPPTVGIIYNGLVSATASTSFSSTIYVSPDLYTQFSNLTIMFVICSYPNSTLSALSLSSVGALTTLGTVTDTFTSSSVTIAYVKPGTATGSLTLSGTKSVSSLTMCQYMLLDSPASSFSAPTSQTFSSVSTSSCTVSGAKPDDHIIDVVLYGKYTSATAYDTVPSNQRFLGLYFPTQSTTSPYSYASSSYAIATQSGSFTMSRSYGVAQSGTHMCFILSSYRTASSVAPTLVDSITLAQNNIRYLQSKPAATSEITDLTTILTKQLVPTSSRYQILNATGSVTNSWRVAFLPRADQLPLGTIFSFQLHTSCTIQNSFTILPFSFSVNTNGASSIRSIKQNPSWWYNNPFAAQSFDTTGILPLSNSTNTYKFLTATLLDNTFPQGQWLFHGYFTSISNTSTIPIVVYII